MSSHRVVGVGFDHMHMGDQLKIVAAHPDAELVGVLDTDLERMASVCAAVGLAGVPQAHAERAASALDAWAPDVAIVCSKTSDHPYWTELLARRGVHVLLEKPFANDVAAADAMITAAATNGTSLGVNWPLAWYPTHRTARRLIAEGAVGEVSEVHSYGGNRGPLFHLHDKIEVEPSAADKAGSWWYSKAAGGGSLLDYLGYGTTLGTWFRDGEAPHSVTAVTWAATGLEVDEQSVVIATYAAGLSTFHTRWGTFADPWNHLTQPRTGFTVLGTAGSLSSFDYDAHVTLQDADHLDGTRVPADAVAPEVSTGLAALLHHLDTGADLDGPVSVRINRISQRIVDAAVLSAATRQQVGLGEQDETPG